MAWCLRGGRNDTSLRRARDEEWRACSMISERCACGCDSSARRQPRRPAAGMGARLGMVGSGGQPRRLPAAQPVAPPHSRVGTAWPAGAGLDWPGHGARGGVALLRAGRRSERFFRAHPQCSTELSLSEVARYAYAIRFIPPR